MAAATRSRGFPNLNMLPASGDKPQQPVSAGSGFPLYPNENIWTSSLSSARERSIGAKDADEGHARSSARSSVLNANAEADVWASSANPWNKDGRSVSTSPSRTRDGAVANGPGYFDHQPPAAMGLKRGSFGSKPFHDDSNAYSAAFAAPKRNSQEAAAAYMDPIMALSQPRDSSMPPPRQSQGSPAYQDLYRAGHTPTNSMQSQRQMANHTAHNSTQSTNQRAFNLNNQIDDDLALQLGRRVALDGISSNTPSFSSSSQPFQLNPGSQPWMGEGSGSRYGPGGLEFASDAMSAQYSPLKRPSMERMSPGPNYLLDSNNGSRAYGPTTEPWSARPSSRDLRPADLERRTPAHQYAPGFTPSFYPGQFPYANLPAPYAAGFLDPYHQNLRQHPLMASYGLHTMHAGYPLDLPPLRPPLRDQDPGRGMRSAVLDEFRLSNKSSKRYELKDIYDHVVEFSGDQHGSRFIQQKLESANSDEKDQVFREIESNAIQLMKDVFGNYVVQKFFEHGSQVQKRVLAEKMKGKVFDLSVQVYACRVVQKALEHVLVDQQAELAKELEGEVLKVARDQNGNHVVQKMIELVPRKHMDAIMKALCGQVTGLASHMYGCRVVQRMLEHGTEADKAIMMEELHMSAQILLTDQFGNYVAQHVIQNGNAADQQRMIELVMAQLFTLSKHKFASNVVEKCIEYGTPAQRSSARVRLTTVGADGSSPLQQMMRDQYGNYVIQKLLSELQGAEREALVEAIRPQFFALKKNGTTRQLQALEKLLELEPETPAKSGTPDSVRSNYQVLCSTNT